MCSFVFLLLRSLDKYWTYTSRLSLHLHQSKLKETSGSTKVRINSFAACSCSHWTIHGRGKTLDFFCFLLSLISLQNCQLANGAQPTCIFLCVLDRPLVHLCPMGCYGGQRVLLLDGCTGHQVIGVRVPEGPALQPSNAKEDGRKWRK